MTESRRKPPSETCRQKLCPGPRRRRPGGRARLARDLKPWFGVAKVGLELFSAVGPDAIGPLIDLGYEVFVDLKLHDIPTTVEQAAQVLGALGRRATSRCTPTAASPCCGPGSRGLPRGRPAPACPSPSPSPSPCSRATPTRPRTSCRSGSAWPPRAAAAASCARSATWPTSAR